jgi:hypothetical protein
MTEPTNSKDATANRAAFLQQSPFDALSFRRRRHVSPPSQAEVAQMVAAFLGRGGVVQKVPAAFVAPSNAGQPRKADVTE